MSKITHSYFGALDNDKIKDTDVIWESQSCLNDQELDIWLWAAPGETLDTQLLDAFASTLQQLPTLDERARVSLLHYLEKDSSFLAFHVDEAQVEGAENLQATQALIAQAQAAGKDAVAATEFVRAMQLNNISLWCSNEDAPIVLDYRIDAQGSDQILAVKCDAQGQITDINWES